MKEISIKRFCTNRETPNVITAPCLRGPALTVVDDHRQVQGAICGLAVVSQYGYVIGQYWNHDTVIDVMIDCIDQDSSFNIGNHTRGFVTDKAEFLERDVAGAWALSKGIIKPTYEGQVTKNLYSYDITGNFASYPFEV